MFNLKLDILPPAQRLLWKDLSQTPDSFVLYGGTAIALRLGHRQSVDFDFFTNESFEPARLLSGVQYLKNARIDQRGDNTLSVVVDRSGPVKVSFFGDVQMNCAQQPDVFSENGLQVASLLDLIATKLKTIQQRAEAKDYLDIAAALHSGIELPMALAAATAIYGKTFNVLTALKALTYFGDGNLSTLPPETQHLLRKTAESTNLEAMPRITAHPGIVRSDSSR